MFELNFYWPQGKMTQRGYYLITNANKVAYQLNLRFHLFIGVDLNSVFQIQANITILAQTGDQ